MHCPSCGQQQVSNETKFCSRCGLPLGVVSEVLAYGGYLPQLAELNKKKKPFLSRRNVMGLSLIWLLFFLFIMTPFWGIVGVDALSGVSAIMGIFGGLIMMVSALIFIPKEKIMYQVQQNAFPPPPGQYNMPPQHNYGALPPQQSIPASVYAPPQAGNWRDTNDLQPTTVTEATTRLLEKDEI
ncbi:hypothetical protein BH10ACI2_BH10ACI2_15880 [soil metagenome]